MTSAPKSIDWPRALGRSAAEFALTAVGGLKDPDAIESIAKLRAVVVESMTASVARLFPPDLHGAADEAAALVAQHFDARVAELRQAIGPRGLA